MHALNNAVGEHCFEADDMDFAAQVYMSEDGWEIGDGLADHVGAAGWYSSEVLATALRTKAMAVYDRIKWTLELAPLRRSDELQTCLGAIQNRGSVHWASFRCFGDVIYELDSMSAIPKAITQGSFEAMLRLHPTYPIRLL